MMRKSRAYLAAAPQSLLEVVDLQRRDLRVDDLAVRVTFCGVCHSDLHALHQSERGFPIVPGHEFVGEVVAVGDAVQSFVVGDAVAVGNIVDACGRCQMCLVGQENFCVEFPTLTYGGTDRRDGSPTMGAFASEYVVGERFAYRLPRELDPAGVAPLMCAGITVWEPLRSHGVGPGSKVAVVGLGGLGHLAVKLAAALGAEVAVFTTSPHKADDARALGASDVIVSTEADQMASVRDRFDLVMDTISSSHELEPYLRTVALDGALCMLGHLGPVTVDPITLLVGRKSLTSAGSGGRRYTQELLDFCAEHGIVADVEVLPSADVSTALDRLERNDVRYRFVLDLSDLEPGDQPG